MNLLSVMPSPDKGLKNTNINLKKPQSKIQKTVNSGFGTYAAITSGIFTNSLIMRLIASPYSKFYKKEISKSNEYKDNIIEAVKKSGTVSMGIKVYDCTEKNKDDILKALDETKTIFKNVPFLDKILKNSKKKKFASVCDGKSAMFLSKKNWVCLNVEKRAVSSFHEVGHAMNKMKLGAGYPWVMYLRAAGKPLALLAFFIAACKHKKQEDTKPKNTLDKVTTYIKNNPFKCAFIPMIPTLTEEAMASYNGLKLTKNLLSPDKYAHLIKCYSGAWLTYFGSAAGIAVAACCASKIKDAIDNYKK